LVKTEWKLTPTDTFDALYQAKTDELKRRTKGVIDLLAASENPLRVGEKKGNVWAADISKKHRLAYFVRGNEIVLLKVCDHKQVYGWD